MPECEKAGRFIIASMPTKPRRTDDRWKELEVWQIADALAIKIYSVTQSFPKTEIFGLTSQLRRAALSIPTNIVEGCSRMGHRELARYSVIALGSLGEAKYLLHFANRIGYLSPEHYGELTEMTKCLGAKLWRFSESLRKKE